MLTLFNDMTDTMRMFDSFDRQMQRAFAREARGPDVRDFGFRDLGEALELTAELPGMTDADVDLTLEGDVLTLKAERKAARPEGFRLVRSERREARWLKQLALPCRFDAEAVTAKLVHGVLTVRMPKAAEAKPKKITIGAAAPETPKA